MDFRALTSPRQLGKAVWWTFTFWRLSERLERRRRFQLDQHVLITRSDERLSADAADLSPTAAEYVKIIANSELFDAEGYAARAGFSLKDADPAAHYLVNGEALGLAASERFDARLYAKANPDVANTGTNCLVHFERYGRTEGRSIAPEAEISERERNEADILRNSRLFDATHYAGQLLDGHDIEDFALHYLRSGEAAGLTPSIDFDPLNYREQNRDITRTRGQRLTSFRALWQGRGSPCWSCVQAA